VRLAAYVRADGEIVRGFVSKRPGITGRSIRCVKQKIKGMQTGLALPKKGYVEWRIHLEQERTAVKVVRPASLR
jgi:hypothetical protein